MSVSLSYIHHYFTPIAVDHQLAAQQTNQQQRLKHTQRIQHGGKEIPSEADTERESPPWTEAKTDEPDPVTQPQLQIGWTEHQMEEREAKQQTAEPTNTAQLPGYPEESPPPVAQDSYQNASTQG
jgi:hypothetical protein